MYGQDDFSETLYSELKRSRKSQIITFIILFVLIVAFSIWRSGGSSMSLKWSEAILSVTDPDGNSFSLDLRDLKSLSLEADWDFGTCLEGGEDRNYRYGVWENQTVGQYHLYASKASGSVILLNTESESAAVSLESDSVTKDLFEALIRMMDEFGLSPEIS